MDNQQVYIIPLSKNDDINKKIQAIKASLGSKEHEINILTNSIAVIVKEDYKINLEEYRVDNLQYYNNSIEKDNIKDYNKYRDFIYKMKKINRDINA